MNGRATLCLWVTWYQLAIRKILHGHKVVNSLVKQPMTKLRTPLILAKLQRETNLKPKLNDDTGWISTYPIHVVQAESQKHVLLLDNTEIEALQLSPVSKRKVNTLIKTLKKSGWGDKEATTRGCYNSCCSFVLRHCVGGLTLALGSLGSECTYCRESAVWVGVPKDPGCPWRKFDTRRARGSC